jgi:hypothetical protein
MLTLFGRDLRMRVGDDRHTNAPQHRRRSRLRHDGRNSPGPRQRGQRRKRMQLRHAQQWDCDIRNHE